MPRFASIEAATFYNLYAGVAAETEYDGQTMLFVQATAPTGWVVDDTYNENTIRVTTGGISSGGSTNFSTLMSATYSVPYSATFPISTSSVSITEAQTPAHTHTASGLISTSITTAMAVVGTPAGPASVGLYTTPGSTSPGTLTNFYGPATPSPTFHSHSTSIPFSGTTTLNMELKYVDMIHATKSPS